MTKTSPTTEHRAAFTLVELLVAATVAALVLAAATGSWFAALRANREVALGAAAAQCLRTAHERLGDDLARATAAPQATEGAVTFPARDAAGRPGRCRWSFDRRVVRRWQGESGAVEELAWPLDGLTARASIDPGQGVRVEWRPASAADAPPLSTVLVALADRAGGRP